ncbi:APC family permease [Spirosoma sp. BT702]|uniref:APC family permease n=1 Tax=Spirosoma profusum TaxID=2771354 RepID=A0A927GA04_9BACT|nr:APC family permease [Spirosoma profusum]MBD2704814.1 APC family permease [Spirosoma profusum]
MKSNKMLAELIPQRLLNRVLERFDLMSLYFALIFGSYGAAQMTAEGWAGIPMMLLAALTFLLPTALASYELGTLFPGEGGIYIWSQKALGPIHGFISGWLSWVPIFLLLPLGASTIVAHIGFIFNTKFTLGVNITLQAIVVVIITIISCFRLALSQKYINLMFFVSFGTAIIIFLCALFSNNQATPFREPIINSFDVFKHGAMYSAAILWLLGVEVPFNMGAEIKDHKKNAGFMFLWGTVALLIAYILGIYGVLKLLPVGSINAITGISDAVSTVSHSLGIIIAIMICFAVSSQDVAYMNSYSRLLFVSGIEKRLPSLVSYITANKVPLPAILIQSLISIFIIIFFTTQQNLAATFQLYIGSLIVVWVAALFYLYIALPIVRSRYRSLYQNLDLVWKIPGKSIGLWLTITFGIFFNVVAIYFVFANPFTTDIPASEWRKWLTIISLFFIVSGALIYFLSESKVKKINIEEEIKKYENPNLDI